MIVFITGANRGIGLHQTKCFLEDGDTVLATYRNKDQSSELFALKDKYEKKLKLVQGDVAVDEDVEAFSFFAKKSAGYIDILINNAGTDIEHNNPGLMELPLSLASHVYDVNALGMIRVCQALLPLVQKSKSQTKGLVVNTTSGIGTMSSPVTMTRYGYMMSKAAVNMLSRVMAFEFENTGPTVIAWSPGWVRTRLGTEAATYSVEEAGRKNVDVIKSITKEQNGQLLDISGKQMEF